MSGIGTAGNRQDGRGLWAAGLVLGITAMLAPGEASAQTERDGFPIVVFALSGPACGGPVILGEECPDVLLPGAELLLQRRNRRTGEWQDVTRLRTNRNGYADLFVERRGLYRVDAPPNDSVGIFPLPLPFFEGPVQFRVPARHETEAGFRLTPVVVHFDSGIR